ncbi:alpha-amylase family glycosyl hydrolase [Litchfieldia salsa]|uniref:Alpha-amylase n=1 Tax=Litchfieldia salsa TaxID=930152 RepID=A0A1H0UMS5_9BACI|nr:alpha-amylase family glycosyl hydrolase [Litchfieldia salsa]SDP67146.1 alpha-amylase [Litchfieldia salsa]
MKGFKRVLFLLSFLLLITVPVHATSVNGSNEVIYSIMVDRFNNGDPTNDYDVNTNDQHAYHGGDLKGISAKLDYIKDMGFTTILLSSIFGNGQKYKSGDQIDYFEVDQHFGSIEDLRSLIGDAHEKNLKVMIEFPASASINEDELLNAGAMWVNETGIDGYHLTNMNQVSVDFWVDFYQEITNVNKEFLFIAEANKSDLETYKSVGFTYLADPTIYQEAASILSDSDQSFSDSIIDTEQLSVKYVDSKDTIRFTRRSLENEEHPVTRLKLALSYLYLTPGVPIIYYGTEIVQDGGEPPTNSPLMNFRTDDELEKYMTMLSKIRSGVPSITKGNYDVLHQTEDGMLVLKSTYEERTDIVVINNSTKTQKVTINSEELDDNKQLRGLIEENVFVEEAGEYTIILDREKAEVFHLEDRQGINIGFVLTIVIIPLLMIVFFILNRRKHQKR